MYILCNMHKMYVIAMKHKNELSTNLSTLRFAVFIRVFDLYTKLSTLSTLNCVVDKHNFIDDNTKKCFVKFL